MPNGKGKILKPNKRSKKPRGVKASGPFSFLGEQRETECSPESVYSFIPCDRLLMVSCDSFTIYALAQLPVAVIGAVGLAAVSPHQSLLRGEAGTQRPLNEILSRRPPMLRGLFKNPAPLLLQLVSQ